MRGRVRPGLNVKGLLLVERLVDRLMTPMPERRWLACEDLEILIVE